MSESLIERRISPQGFTIKVDIRTLTFSVYTPKGLKENYPGLNTADLAVQRVVFLGDSFHLEHFITGELSFVNSKDSKMNIPYLYGGAKEQNTISLPCYTYADITPVILHHYKTAKEIIQIAQSNQLSFKCIIAEETNKSEIVNLKIRFPQTNIFIIKRKQA
ncbi:MAG: hypothetical protein SFU98_21470 [Leptospiraceae bacterium]|nr:hypothetical protein [Leptospiraceae bacterium]